MTPSSMNSDFLPLPGKRNAFATSFEVRQATYKITLVSIDEATGAPEQSQYAQRVPAARLARHLRRLERDYSELAGPRGFVFVSAHRPSDFKRVWIIPLGQIRGKVQDLVRSHASIINLATRILVGNGGAEQRLVTSADRIEDELGITQCRKQWQAARELCPFLDRSSPGHAMVAVHGEICEAIAGIVSEDEAVSVVQQLLWEKTSIRAKTRDILQYVNVCMAALATQQGQMSAEPVRLMRVV